jgi:transposase
MRLADRRRRGSTVPARWYGAADNRNVRDHPKVGWLRRAAGSSERQRRTAITKAGPSSLRRTLIQGAWTALRTRPDDPMVPWTLQIAERRPKPVAVVTLARKMSCILFAVWRDGSTYALQRGAQATS